MAPTPQPTTSPLYNTALTSTGYSSYIPMSSTTDIRAANYVSPSSSTSTQVNAYGAPLYQSNPFGTTSQVVQTNPSTGEFTQSSGGGGGFDRMDRSQNPGEGWFYDAADGWKQAGGSSGPDYSAYFAALDDRMNSLGTQRASQEQVAQNTYDQGMNTLKSQYDTGKQNIEKSRVKTLRDLTENMRQAWQQGNAMLGTRGASDSSAANQYSYALTKFGNQQRGDVQAEYNNQLFNLDNTYNTEANNLKLNLDNQLQSIAQWFTEAMDSVKGLVGQAKLQQSQEAYNYAQQLVEQAYQETSNRRAALDQWALERATSYKEAAQALGFIGNQTQATPTFNNMFGNYSTGSTGASTGYGYSNEKDMFGNRI